MLLQHFMQRVADEFGMTPVVLDAAQLAGLCAKDWPGNVRELRNFVERTRADGRSARGSPAASAGAARSARAGRLPRRLDARAGQAGAHRARADAEPGQSLCNGAATGRVRKRSSAGSAPAASAATTLELAIGGASDRMTQTSGEDDMAGQAFDERIHRRDAQVPEKVRHHLADRDRERGARSAAPAAGSTLRGRCAR